jgi:hypothetical protein
MPRGGPYTGYYIAPLLSPSIAESAVATASGEVAPQTAAMAIDRVATGYPADFHRAWASGGGVGGWIQLTWTKPPLWLDVEGCFDEPSSSFHCCSAVVGVSWVPVPA